MSCIQMRGESHLFRKHASYRCSTRVEAIFGVKGGLLNEVAERRLLWLGFHLQSYAAAAVQRFPPRRRSCKQIGGMKSVSRQSRVGGLHGG